MQKILKLLLLNIFAILSLAAAPFLFEFPVYAADPPSCLQAQYFPNNIDPSNFAPIQISDIKSGTTHTIKVNWASLSSSVLNAYTNLILSGHNLQINITDPNDSSNNHSGSTNPDIVTTPEGSSTPNDTYTFSTNGYASVKYSIYIYWWQVPGQPCTFSNVLTLDLTGTPPTSGNVTTIGGVCNEIDQVCGKTPGGVQLACATDPTISESTGVCIPKSELDGGNYCLTCSNGALSGCTNPSYSNCHSATTTNQCVQGQGCQNYTDCFYCASPGYYDKATQKCIGSSPVKITCAGDGSETCDPDRKSQTCIKVSNINIGYTSSQAPCDDNGGTKNCDSIVTALGTIYTNPKDFVNGLLGLILSISGGVLVILIILTGYRLMTSQGDPEKIKEARERLTSALVGLFFIIFSFVFYQFITHNILNLPGFK